MTTVTLAEHRPEPAPGVVRLLEDLLCQAQTGEISGFAYALTKGGRGTAQGWSASERSVDLLGAVSLLQAALVVEIDASTRWTGEPR